MDNVRDKHSAAIARCTFCDLIRGAAEVSICYEDADAIAFMDIQPVNRGHVLVVPRAHYESLQDLPRGLAMHLFDVTMRLSSAVRRVTGRDDMNIVVNSGVAAGQDEPHYHVHIIPRQAADGFTIPLPFNGSEMPDRTVLDAYAARIIAAMDDPVRADGHAAVDRPAEVPLFREQRAPAREDARDTRIGRGSPSGERERAARRWRPREGAHGELLYEPSSTNPEGS